MLVWEDYSRGSEYIGGEGLAGGSSEVSPMDMELL